MFRNFAKVLEDIADSAENIANEVLAVKDLRMASETVLNGARTWNHGLYARKRLEQPMINLLHSLVTELSLRGYARRG